MRQEEGNALLESVASATLMSMFVTSSVCGSLDSPAKASVL